MKYATYNEYKPSNIGWIRDFPAHWELKRLKYVANRAEVKVEADEDNPLPYIGLEHVEPWTGRLIDLDDDLVPTGVSNRFAAGDTLFGKLRPYLAKACNVDFDGLCSSELLVLRGKTYDRKFLLYQLLSHGFINLVDSSTYGSKMPRASWDFIGICELPLPPIDEQQTIARFLDAKTAQIDALVAQKRQLIDKLKEKRQALIARTVTRGLPPEAAKAAGLEPNPEMKDSGVDWLGEVPARWKVLPLRRLIKFVKTGGTPSGAEEQHFEECGFNWYSPSDFSDDIYLGPTNRALSAEGKAEVRVFPEKTVMLVGIGATIGKVGLALGTSSCNQQINAIGCGPKLDPVFATYYLKILRDFIVKCGKFTTMPIINQDETKNLFFTAPPLSEQSAIADYLDRETVEINRLMVLVDDAISRLIEYRQAIITSAVTGKIDVRGVT